MSNNNQNRPAVPQPPQQNRDSRDMETRAVEAREETWAPPDTLPDIVKIPGYAYRWIRTATHGEDDPMNISSKFREHWAPVPLDEQKHMAPFNDPRAAQKGNVEIGGLMLCKVPEKVMQQREKYYEHRNRLEQETIDNNFMKDNDPRMPLFRERKSKVTFGNGGA